MITCEDSFKLFIKKTFESSLLIERRINFEEISFSFYFCFLLSIWNPLCPQNPVARGLLASFFLSPSHSVSASPFKRFTLFLHGKEKEETSNFRKAYPLSQTFSPPEIVNGSGSKEAPQTKASSESIVSQFGLPSTLLFHLFVFTTEA